MKTNELDEYFATRDKKEEDTLNKQMKDGLKLLTKWETVFREECPRLFENTLNGRIPYWRHWIGKYRWVAPSIAHVLQERWETYKILKRNGETKNLKELF